MRKFLIAFLAALCCGLTVVAVGCQDSCNSNPSGPQEYSVVFTPTENLTYVCDGLKEGETTLTVESGTTVNFSVEVPFLYTVPAVYANDKAITADGGVYSLTVTSDVTIRTGAVQISTAYFTGSGTSESPYLISNPVDYFAVAQVVNSGNANFTGAYFALNEDIDFGGEEIPVIGDGSTANSFFMGNFNGKAHTLSNFKIKTYGSTYVGLFGYLVSSGQADDTGVIANLNIDNFEITAEASSLKSMFVGSIVGYSMASTVIACSATNGYIKVIADTAAFSYVGGAIGAQTSAIISNGTTIDYYPALTGYVSTDVDIDALGGVLAAGGVIGAVVSENERAISLVVNSYSKGDVFGGIYSGGVVGNLSDYSSMANCYSLSEVYANSRYRDNETYSYSYAGGLTGYLGNNAVATDSFALCKVGGQASSGTSFVKTGDLIGGKAPATVVAGEGVLYNCKSGDEVSTTESFFKNTLCWQECDWVFVNGSYPVINQAENEVNTFTVTFDYSGKKAGGSETRDLKIRLSEDFYSPMFYFYQPEKNISGTDGEGEEFSDIIVADSGETSYGFFFDKELTQKVPYGFVPTRNITLYTGFINYSAVAGTYYLVSRVSQRQIKLILDTNGVYIYNDGVELSGAYTYDGTKLLFDNAIFARLSDTVTISDDNFARPDLNYNFLKFAAKKTEKGLEIYDGNFFTEAEPLKANSYAISGEWYYGSDDYVFYTDNTGRLNNQKFTYELTSAGTLTVTIGKTVKTGSVNGDTVVVGGNTLKKYDAFKGVWEIASNVYRRYEFDGKSNWSYTVKGVVKDSGTYDIASGVATLKSGLTAEIDPSGLLLINNSDNKEYYAKENSFSGTWVDYKNNVIINFNGFGDSLSGEASIRIGGAQNELTYILDGFFDADGNMTVTLLNGYSLFGYLTRNKDGSFAGTFFSANTLEYLSGYNFYLLDTLDGEWVGEGTLGGKAIDSLEFNGLGLYEKHGSVTVNGEDGFSYTLDGNFDAVFGTDYTVSFDDQTGKITLTSSEGSVELQRKDAISSYVLISEDNTKFTFNGGGDLTKGGKLTITDADGKIISTLGYKNLSGSIADRKLTVELYSEFRGSEQVGEITIANEKFNFAYTGSVTGLKDLTSSPLTIDNPFSGYWAASDFNTNIYIGKLDLSNSIEGTFLDMTNATFTYKPENDCLMVAYQTGEMTTPVALYLIMLGQGNMVISSYEVLTSGDNIVYCATQDTYRGTWKNRANNQKTITFDGMSNSLYTLGVARDEGGNLFYYTKRFGKVYFWSADGARAYIIEKDNSAEGENAYFTVERNRIVFNDFDLKASILKIVDNGKVYDFYLTHVEVDGERKNYTLTKVDGDITELVIYDGEADHTGVSYTVNHANKTIEQAD